MLRLENAYHTIGDTELDCHLLALLVCSILHSCHALKSFPITLLAKIEDKDQ